MAYLHRLILSVVLALLSAPASASFPATQTNTDQCTVAPCYAYSTRSIGSTAPTLPYLPTKSEACNRAADGIQQNNAAGAYAWRNPIIVLSSDVTCYMRDSAGSPQYYDWPYSTQSANPVPPQYSCPANSTLSGNLCTCDATYTEENGTCVPPAPVNNCEEMAGSTAGSYTGLGGLGAKTICVQDASLTSSGDPAAPGCVLTGDANFAAGDPLRWVTEMTFTGAKCIPSEPAPEAPEEPTPTECPPGKVPGTVNGSTICVDPGPTDTTQSTGTSTNNTTNPDGSTTQTQETTTVTCEGSICVTSTTTTTTTTPSGGGTPVTETTTQEGTCTRGSPGCGDEEQEPSSFGGSCGQFSCDGDAVMCAVALEQHKRNCALFVDQSPESQLYESEKDKTGPQYASESVAIGPSSFSQSNAIGGSAQCIPDLVVTVWNSQVSLPFSQVCGALQYLGTVLMFVSFLLAYRIVSRG